MAATNGWNHQLTAKSAVNMPGGLLVLMPGIPGATSRGFLGFCTVCLFKIDGQWALFDTGQYNDRLYLLEALNQAGVSPQQIRYVVLSHLHFDHVLNLPLFKQAEVLVSKAELQYAENVCTGQLQDPCLVDAWQGFLEGRMLHRLDAVQEIASGLEFFTLPGHTPGCMALMIHAEGKTTAICGDVIKNAWEAVNRKSKTALAGEDIAAKSIEKVLEMAQIIVPGHDRPFVMRGGKPHFLNSTQFSVHMSAYPEGPDHAVLELKLTGNNEINRP